MNLILWQVEVPDVLVSGDQDFDDAIGCRAVVGSHERPKVSRPAARSRRSELDADSKPVSGWNNISFELRSKFDAEYVALHHRRRTEIHHKNG